MVITKTPLRISFAGGGTDFPEYYLNSRNGGQVLSTTIDKYIYVLVKKRFDNKIVAHYRQTEMVDKLSDLKHGVIRECLKYCGIHKQIEVSPTADIAGTGSGLGSSSALTVGLLNALYSYRGIPQTKDSLARHAYGIEAQILSAPIGKQDHEATTWGGLNNIKFGPKGTIIACPDISKDTLNELEQDLLLFYTGIAREASTVLSEQKENIPHKLYILDEMVDLVDEMIRALEESNLETFAIRLNTGWNLKKQLARTITNSTINDIYNLALRSGALGGKICGAGGGGFILFYCPHNKQQKLRKALKDLQELRFRFDSLGTRVLLNVKE